MQKETQASILSDISDLEESSNTDSTPYQNQPESKPIHEQNCSDDEFDNLVNLRNIQKQDEQKKLEKKAKQMLQHMQHQNSSGGDEVELDDDDDLYDEDSMNLKDDGIDQYMENEKMSLLQNKKAGIGKQKQKLKQILKGLKEIKQDYLVSEEEEQSESDNSVWIGNFNSNEGTDKNQIVTRYYHRISASMTSSQVEKTCQIPQNRNSEKKRRIYQKFLIFDDCVRAFEKASRNENPLTPYTNQMVENTKKQQQDDVPLAQQMDPQSMQRFYLIQSICTKNPIKIDTNNFNAIRKTEYARKWRGLRGPYSKPPLIMETPLVQINQLPFQSYRCERNNNNGEWKQIRYSQRKAYINEKVKKRLKIEKQSKIEAIKELIQKGELHPEILGNLNRTSSESKSEHNSQVFNEQGSNDQKSKQKTVLYIWTEQEYDMLKDLIKKHGKQWKKIASIIGSKNEQQCQRRGSHLLKQLQKFNFDNELYQILKVHLPVGGASAKRKSQRAANRKKVEVNKQKQIESKVKTVSADSQSSCRQKSSKESKEQISDTDSEDLETSQKTQTYGMKQSKKQNTQYLMQPVNPNRHQLSTRLLTNKNDKCNINLLNTRRRQVKEDSKNTQIEQQNPFLIDI